MSRSVNERLPRGFAPGSLRALLLRPEGGLMQRYPQIYRDYGSPTSNTTFESVYHTISAIAGARAAGVARLYGLSDADRSDLEQEALFHGWRNLATFDPTRSSLKTFIECIVARKLISLARGIRARKRCVRTDASARTYVDSEADRLNLRIDIFRLLQGLQPDQRDICRMLADSSVTDISRRAGISRATIYRTINRLQVVFTEAGLHRSLGRGDGC